MEFAGLIVFFLIYKFAPQEYALRAASIFLLIFSIIQILYFKLLKLKVPRSMLFINGLSIAFAIPTIYFNDFQYIRIKLLVIKAIFFIVPFVFVLFGKNFQQLVFGDLAGIKELTNHEFKVVNWWFIIVSGVSLLITLYAYFNLSDDAFLELKTFWLPAVGALYIIPIFYYLMKKDLNKKP
ncbi:septation protein IspZ [Psittacicella hinzii]|nr:septation protein IspZ [Psittacicella hinzii]